MAFERPLLTIHPIIHPLNLCAEYINNSNHNHTLAILCDIGKTFDVISFDILANKLHFYGTRGSTNQWFNSYQSNWHHYVKIDGHKPG